MVVQRYSGRKDDGDQLGRHHVDIAQWAIEQNAGPSGGVVSVERACTPSIRFHSRRRHAAAGRSLQPALTKFNIKCMFANGVGCTLSTRHPTATASCLKDERDGFHVGRGRNQGRSPFEQLKDNPCQETPSPESHGGKEANQSYAELPDCVKSRETPIRRRLDAPSCHDNRHTWRTSRSVARQDAGMGSTEQDHESPGLNSWQVAEDAPQRLRDQRLTDLMAA